MNKLFKKKAARVEEPFPKLMKAIDADRYVYFIKPDVGIVVYGKMSDSPFPWDMKTFTDTDDQVLINCELQGKDEGMNKNNCDYVNCEARHIKTYREIEMCRLADNNLYQIALNLTGNKEKYLNSAQELIDKHGNLVARKMSMEKIG